MAGGNSNTMLRDSTGEELVVVSERISTLEAYNAIDRAYESGKLTAGLYLNHVQGLLTLGLPPDYVDWKRYDEVENASIEAVLDGLNVERGHERREIVSDVTELPDSD